MFGNKKKLDPKIRFQKVYFKRQLQQARGYRRPIKKLPTGFWQIFLSKIGLGSWAGRLATLLVLAAAVYFVFIPNPFFIKNVIVNGVKPEDRTEIQTTVNFYLQRHSPWPQKNLLLLSKTGLRDYLLKNNQTVLAVTEIEKKWPSTLTVSVRPRYGKFLIRFPTGQFLASNDGVLLQSLSPEQTASSSTVSNSVILNLTANDAPGLGQKYLSDSLANLLEQASQQLPEVIKTKVLDFVMLNADDLDLKAETEAGYYIVFDVKSDLGQTLSELSLLLDNLSPAQINKLLYIDLRFKNRSYVCLKDSACAQPTVLPQPTTTPDSILPINPVN